jgi:4-amino-4-deoxy-L-arabinose transferase-like glycosyltransferase
MKIKIVFVLITILALVHIMLVLPAIDYPERFRIVDSEGYIDLANNLLETGRYQGQVSIKIDLVRTPGYPAFLALGMLIFSDVKWISLLQVFLVFVNCFILFRITLELGYKKAGYAAVIIYLLSINVAFEALNILTETFTSFWLILSLWMLVKFWSTEKGRWLFLSGLSQGICTLVRPICFPLFIIWCLFLLIISVRRLMKPVLSRQDIKNLMVFLSGGLFLILLWSARNFIVHREFAISSVAGTTFRNYIAAIPIAEVNHVSQDEAKDMIFSSGNPDVYIMEFIKYHPAAFLKAQARGILNTLISVSYPSWAYALTGIRPASTGIISSLSFDLIKISDQIHEGNLWILSGIGALLYDLILYIMCLIASVRMFLPGKNGVLPKLGLILIVTLSYMIITPLAQGSSRFRIPIEPYLALLAAFTFIPTNSKGMDYLGRMGTQNPPINPAKHENLEIGTDM